MKKVMTTAAILGGLYGGYQLIKIMEDQFNSDHSITAYEKLVDRYKELMDQKRNLIEDKLSRSTETKPVFQKWQELVDDYQLLDELVVTVAGTIALIDSKFSKEKIRMINICQSMVEILCLPKEEFDAIKINKLYESVSEMFIIFDKIKNAADMLFFAKIEVGMDTFLKILPRYLKSHSNQLSLEDDVQHQFVSPRI